jgi:hypothetical protein
VRFEFYRLRLDFTASESIFFPAGKAGNILRGALGMGLGDSPIFAPVAVQGGPSGLRNPPPPFVFRARELDGRTLKPGESFGFGLHIFALDRQVVEEIIDAFGGTGLQYGRAMLRNVTGAGSTVRLELETPSNPVDKIRVEFLSPTELKHGGAIVERPEFAVLFGRIRNRISTLCALYGAGPLALDFRGIGLRAAAVQMTKCDVRSIRTERRSTRTGQTHSIGGFTGVAEYQGDLTEFLPYLEAAQWTGVGRHAVWGNGEISSSQGG